MRQTTIACALACVLCATVSVPAQSPQAPAFEVASVRMAGAGPLTSRITDTRVDISQPMISILSTAFRADARRLVVPDLNDAYVEIRATVPAGATRQQVPEMLQRLLVERFGLVWHRELRLTDGQNALDNVTDHVRGDWEPGWRCDHQCDSNDYGRAPPPA
jgi:hypothetical protein